MKKQLLDITGMSCSACSSRIEKVVNRMQGVEQMSVNLLKIMRTLPLMKALWMKKRLLPALKSWALARECMLQELPLRLCRSRIRRRRRWRR